MRIPSLIVLAFLATGATQAADLSIYNGRWRPDQDANTRLAMASVPVESSKCDSGKNESRSRGDDGDHSGKAGENKSGGGDHSGGKSGESKSDGGSSCTQTQHPFVDAPVTSLIAPQATDLLFDLKGDEVVFGADGQAPLKLKIDGAAQLLSDGRTRAKLYRNGADLVLEIDGDDGLKVTHTYRLEGDGKRLRILSVTEHPSSGRPQESQRLYRRPASNDGA